MKKYIIVFTLTLSIFFHINPDTTLIKADEPITLSPVSICIADVPAEECEPVYSIEKTVPHEYIETDDLEILTTKISYYQNKKEIAHQMAEMARALGYEDNHLIIQLAKREWEEAHELYTKYTNDYNFWLERKTDYPVATEIWLYLKNLGYNNYVIAGILGNIMAEVGGNTLDIQYWLYGGKVHYGMCQWNITYYSSIVGGNLQEQCDFLRDTIEYEINTFGRAYQKDFSYEKFLALQDAQEVALAFAKSYERCSSAYYSVRKTNALKAYEYFIREE